MFWHGTDGLSLTSHVFPAADTVSFAQRTVPEELLSQLSEP